MGDGETGGRGVTRDRLQTILCRLVSLSTATGSSPHSLSLPLLALLAPVKRLRMWCVAWCPCQRNLNARAMLNLLVPGGSGYRLRGARPPWHRACALALLLCCSCTALAAYFERRPQQQLSFNETSGAAKEEAARRLQPLEVTLIKAHMCSPIFQSPPLV